MPGPTRAQWARACKLIDLMGSFVGKVAPGSYSDFYADLNEHFITAAKLARYRRPPGECAFCDAHPDEGPSHTPSESCESGRHPHCTCDVCF